MSDFIEPLKSNILSKTGRYILACLYILIGMIPIIIVANINKVVLTFAPTIFAIIALVIMIALYVLFVIRVFRMAMVPSILVDENISNKSVAIQYSIYIMNGNKKKYLGLYLTYIAEAIIPVIIFANIGSRIFDMYFSYSFDITVVLIRMQVIYICTLIGASIVTIKISIAKAVFYLANNVDRRDIHRNIDLPDVAGVSNNIDLPDVAGVPNTQVNNVNQVQNVPQVEQNTTEYQVPQEPVTPAYEVPQAPLTDDENKQY